MNAEISSDQQTMIAVVVPFSEPHEHRALADWLRTETATSVQICADVGEAVSLSAGEPERRTLVLCPSPDEAVAAALIGGVSAAQAVAGWCRQAEDLLASVRGVRRHVVVIALDALRNDPASCFGAAGIRLLAPEETPFPLPSPDAAVRLLAGAALHRDRTARALISELQASLRVASGDGFAPEDLAAVMEDLRARQAALVSARHMATEQAVSDERFRQSIRENQEERDAVLGQMLETQEKLIGQRQEVHMLQERLEQLSREAQSAAEKTQSATAKCRTAEDELNRVQKALQQETLLRKKLEADLNGARKAADKARRDVERILASSSMRLTAPLRRLRALLSHRSR